MRRVLLALVLVLGGLWPSPGDAQTPVASVAGTVATHDGARIPFATLTLTDTATGRTWRGATDGRGLFLFDQIPAGTYDLTIDAAGYAPRAVPALEVPAGATHRLSVTLAPASLSEHVTVSAAMPRDSLEQTAVRESGARDVGEALAGTAGVWRVRRGAIASDVVVRGLPSRDLNVLIDGQRVYGACPNRMDPPAFHVDFSEVERVEVGKGPFDVRYQGSMGGLVNIVTRRPPDGWHASPTLSVGSFGFVNPSASVSYGGERMALLAGYSFRRSAPYTDGRGALFTATANYADAHVDAEAFRATTAWGRAAWRLAGGGQIEASYTRQQADQMLYPYLQMDAVYDNADRVAVRLEQPRSGARLSAIRADLTWSRVDHWMTDALRRSAANAPRGYSMGTDAETRTLGGRAEAQLGAGLTFGAEAYRRTWDTTTVMAGMGYAVQHSIPDATIDTAGVFAEYRRALGSKTTLDAGGRLDRIRSAAEAGAPTLALYRAYHATSTTARIDVLPAGRLKLTRQIAPALLVSAGLGHNARVAEPNERFFALRRMGTDWVGNPDLAPSRNTGIDLTAALDGGGRALTVNVFANRLHDYVALYSARRVAMVPGVMNTSARSYTNVDGWLRGVEITGSTQLWPAVSLAADVSYTRGTFEANGLPGVAGGDLAEMPPLRAQARLRVDNGRAFGELGGIASAAQRRVDTALGEAETPAYALLNLHGGLRAGAFAVSVGVANLLDHYYVEHLSYQRDPFRSGVRVAEPGRNLFMNASWKF
ncbi:MAG: TonB-dependent receptor [Vicinamibacterales bacterium]|nr:TonB-dependent receptor [Vicinamibacterales bacterium]